MLNKIVKKFLSEQVFLFVMLLFTIYVVFDSFNYVLESSIVPLIFAVITIFLSVFIVRELITKKEKVEQNKISADASTRLTVTTIILPVYFLLLYIFGYLISTFITVLAYGYLLKIEKITHILLLTIITTVSIYIVFQFAFRIQLPTGILFY